MTIAHRGDSRKAPSAGTGLHRGRRPVYVHFSRSSDSLRELARNDFRVSARVVDLSNDEVLFALDDEATVPGVNVGRLVLLIEVAAGLQSGRLSARELIDREGLEAEPSRGLWRSLQTPTLTLGDLAALVGATNDAWAEQLLLRRVGVDAVRARVHRLGLTSETSEDFARANARQVTTLLSSLAHGRVSSVAVSRQVVRWLSLNSDLSLASSAFGLDPHEHPHSQRGISLINATCNAPGVLSEAAIVQAANGILAFSVSVAGDDRSLAARLTTINALRTLGEDLLERVY